MCGEAGAGVPSAIVFLHGIKKTPHWNRKCGEGLAGWDLKAWQARAYVENWLVAVRTLKRDWQKYYGGGEGGRCSSQLDTSKKLTWGARLGGALWGFFGWNFA